MANNTISLSYLGSVVAIWLCLVVAHVQPQSWKLVGIWLRLPASEASEHPDSDECP